MLLVPLATGAATGLLAGGHAQPLLPLILAALALFWLRTPLENWLGTSAIRARPGSERRLAATASLILASIALAALVWLLWDQSRRILISIGLVAAFAFLLQLAIKIKWRSARVAAQIAGAAGLCATAPAAYAVTTGAWAASAALLWIANWLFAANQIQFVQLRIHGARAEDRRRKRRLGRPFLAAQALLIVILGLVCSLGFYPWAAAIAFVPALVRGFAWFARAPRPLVVRVLGWTELVQTIAFGLLLVWGLSTS
jgi:YwiC-like protein